MIELKYKIWLEKDGKVFGRGPYELLKGIKEKGSLMEAAKDMNMSYNKAFNLIKDIEKKLGYELRTSTRGGYCHGGAALTEEAEKLMQQYEAFIDECDTCLNQIFRQYFKE